VAWARLTTEIPAHPDRITAGGVCADGSWLATGSRDGTLKLWKFPNLEELSAAQLHAEIRSCLFLLDTVSLIVADTNGRLVLYSLPELEPRSELLTRLPLQCAEVSPAGDQIVLGCSDGQVRFVAVDGFDSTPLLVTLTQIRRRVRGTFLQRLFGKPQITHAYHCTCPACRQSFELRLADQAAPCPNCHRSLRIGPFIRTADPEPSLV
jgi:WD40 repeat protein